jgi:hypothetical protein
MIFRETGCPQPLKVLFPVPDGTKETTAVRVYDLQVVEGSCNQQDAHQHRRDPGPDPVNLLRDQSERYDKQWEKINECAVPVSASKEPAVPGRYDITGQQEKKEQEDAVLRFLKNHHNGPRNENDPDGIIEKKSVQGSKPNLGEPGDCPVGE